jgi:hypothetical protein
LPERADEERRSAPLFVRPGVPVVEEVDEVGVRRRPPEYICWGYCCELMVVVGDAAMGKTPEDVVRVRECPGWASKGGTGGRTEMPGFVMGLRRTGRGCVEGAIVAMAAVSLATRLLD